MLTAHVETIRRLEDQLHGMGITPVTGAGSSGLGQTSSSPPPDPVSRDWFFDDPSSSMICMAVFLDVWMCLVCVYGYGYVYGYRGFRAVLDFEPGSRLSGCPAGGRLILTTLYQTPPYNAVSVSIFDPGSILGFRVDPRLSGRNLRLPGRPRLSHSNDPDSLVTLYFHDLRVERMRHWWTLLGEDDHADIVGFFVDLVPTMEEYAELLQLDRAFSETPVIPIRGPRSNRCLEKYLGLTTVVLRPEIARPEETWRKANISLDLLTKYFSRSAFPAKLARDFIVGKKGWKKFRINAFKIAFRSHLRHFYRLQTPYHFERHTVSQTVDIALPFTGNSRDWASYLLDLPLGEWSWKVTWGPAVWKPWTHCALFDGVPLPGVWGCTGYYPSLALRQFGGVQYPPRLGDLDASSSRMVRPEIALLPLTFVEWREGWTPFFTLRPTVRPGHITFLVSRSLRVSASTGQPERVTVLERELEEAQTELLSLRLARAAEREASAARVESLRSTLHHNSVAVANVRRDLVAQRGNVSTLRTMNEFIREQLEISEDAKEQLEENLAEAREQLETEQAERTRVQDELDSLRSYTQALVDPATGRPQDIVALRRALDASEEALTSARTSMGVMRVQISVLQGDNGSSCRLSWTWCMMLLSPMLLGSIRRVSLWSLALHQINQVMDSLGTRARAVWEEHDEGDPALSTALGRFCRETCIRLGH
uniref:Uncharacterized protein n=1 Tax=Fagus sylvatica TaxID=28930 RepID=A0A2N9IRP3_FAGSY